MTNVQFGWGVYAKPDFKTWDGSQIEKAHLQFCKRYLEIKNKASSTACRAELGRFPLNITVNQKRLKYILYIQSKDEESLVKQAFLMSFDLRCNGKNSFHSHLMNMSEYLKLPDFNPDLLDIAYCKKLCNFNETGLYLILAKHPSTFSKLEFYRSFKTDHTSSSYLNLTRGTTGKRALVKLRISNHKLMIEIGNVIKDEVHFLFQRPSYSMIRNKFYYKV